MAPSGIFRATGIRSRGFSSCAHESAAGLALARCQAFPDHHRFTAEESAALITQAEHEGLALLTTEKDRARMTGDPRNEALAARVHVLPVRMEIREAEALRAAVLKAVQR